MGWVEGWFVVRAARDGTEGPRGSSPWLPYSRASEWSPGEGVQGQEGQGQAGPRGRPMRAARR